MAAMIALCSLNAKVRYLRCFQQSIFYLRRGLWNYPGYMAFRYAWINQLGFRSPLAGFLHWFMYLFRLEFYDYFHERSLYSKTEWRAGNGWETSSPDS